MEELVFAPPSTKLPVSIIIHRPSLYPARTKASVCRTYQGLDIRRSWSAPPPPAFGFRTAQKKPARKPAQSRIIPALYTRVITGFFSEHGPCRTKAG